MQYSWFAVPCCETSDIVTWAHYVTKTGFRQSVCPLKQATKKKKNTKQISKTKQKQQISSTIRKQENNCIDKKWKENGGYSLCGF